MSELGKFLRARREGVTPAEAGLPGNTGTRRTPGLRREEVATLAGVSIDYYTRLERGRENRPSPAVVDALAATLRLSAEEHEYLRTLVNKVPHREPASRTIRPTVTLLLETLRPNPALVLNRVNDVLAVNPGGLRLMAGMDQWPARRRNTIRHTFLHPAARSLWPGWEQKARACVAQLRATAGADPDNPDLAALVGELMVKSPDFGRLWERYEVRRVADGEKVCHHPEVGTITLSHEVMELNRTDGQRVVVYMAPQGTADHDAMVLLDRLALDGAREPRLDELTLRGGE